MMMMYESFSFDQWKYLITFLSFQDEDADYQSSAVPKKTQYGPSSDILQNIPNIDRVK
jgi:hypothetical protein